MSCLWLLASDANRKLESRTDPLGSYLGYFRIVDHSTTMTRSVLSIAATMILM